MTARVAINGFGRIGEMVFRTILHEARDLEVVAINDLVSLEQIAYLLKYDSVHPGPPDGIASGPGWLRADGHEVKILQTRDPASLPWADLGVDIVIECTGAFADRDGMSKHLAAGARKVLLSSPAKNDGADLTVCYGVNHDKFEPDRHTLVSNASCTTNCLAPVARVLDEAFGWKWGLMSTVHAYTGSQSLVDAAHKRMRRGRAAAQNIVPTTTGAAQATTEILPRLEGKIDGMAFRVPVPDGSVIDVVFESEKAMTQASLKAAFEGAQADPSYGGVLLYTEDELVSSDILGMPYSAIVDGASSFLLDDHRGKVIAWYDNEWGYACRCRDMAAHMAERMA